MRGIAITIAAALLAACTASREPAGETYVGPLRELWDDGRADRHEAEVRAELVVDVEGAVLTLDGCTVALRRVSTPEDPRRRYVLEDERATCEAGEVEQALVGDPVRREPPPPGEALDAEVWLTRADGAPSLVVFRGERED